MSFPYIDESVQHVGVTRLRSLNAVTLKANQSTLVIRDGDEPLAVLVPYSVFMAMQALLREVERG